MIVADRDQRFQSRNRLGFQALDEVLVRPLPCAGARSQANLFQGDRCGKHNASLAQAIDHRADNCVAAISTCRFPKRSFGDGSIILASKRANAKIVLQFTEMLPAGFGSLCVFTQNARFDLKLASDKGHHVGRGNLSTSENAAGKFQIRKVHGKPQPIGIPASLPDQRQFIGTKCVVPNDRRRIDRRIKQRRARLR